MYGQHKSTNNAYCIMSTLCPRLNGKIWYCVCIYLFFFINAEALLCGPEPIVDTKWGLLRGKWSESLRGRPVANFLGIPYAQPPVADLRFKNPQRWDRTWTTIRDATIDGEQCSQLNKGNIIGGEDCLYLNIFIPMLSNNLQIPAKLPVLVFVHGGGYMFGSSNSELAAPDYLMDQDIILVTLNYRLNILGFFSTTNRASPGNYGIKDVRMALEWIQENIHNFNGNSESVTIMGVSAGAGAVHLLALSNKTEGLFHRYILHSGTSIAPWSFHPKKIYRQTCLELARLVGCLPEADNETVIENLEKENSRAETIYDRIRNINENYTLEQDEEMMNCMRNADLKEMLKMILYFDVWKNNPLCIFGPTLEEDSEEAILTMPPIKIVKEGLFRDIPAIMQIVQDEGLVKTFVFFDDSEAENVMIENFDQYMPYMLEYYESISNVSSFLGAIEDFYFNGDLTVNFKYHITEAVGEAMLIWVTLETVKYHSKLTSNIYFSYFAYEGTFTNFPKGVGANYGVAHGDDMNYLFPILNNLYKEYMMHNTENDVTMINIMTELWANFAKDGVPRAWMIPPWPEYRDNHEFMRFGIGKSPDIVVQTDFLSERMEFWENLMANESVMQYDVYVDESLEEEISTNGSNIDRKLLTYVTLLMVTVSFIIFCKDHNYI